MWNFPDFHLFSPLGNSFICWDWREYQVKVFVFAQFADFKINLYRQIQVSSFSQRKTFIQIPWSQSQFLVTIVIRIKKEKKKKEAKNTWRCTEFLEFDLLIVIHCRSQSIELTAEYEVRCSIWWKMCGLHIWSYYPYSKKSLWMKVTGNQMHKIRFSYKQNIYQ
jgi:hypothetical protein